MKVQAEDSAVVPAPMERVYALLDDLSGYGAWWPKPVAFHQIAPGRARVSNGPAVWWTFTVVRADRPKSIQMLYDGGAWRGPASWTLEPAPGGTRVTYRVDLDVTWPWLRLLGRAVPFARLHSRQMVGALAALGRAAGREDARPARSR